MNEQTKEQEKLPEASPETKGQCNDERACAPCYSGQGVCDNKPAQEPNKIYWKG